MDGPFPAAQFSTLLRAIALPGTSHTHSGLEGKPSGGAFEGALDCCFVNGGDDSSWGEGVWWQPANTTEPTARATATMVRTFSPLSYLALPEAGRKAPLTARRGIHSGGQAAAVSKRLSLKFLHGG